MKRKKRYTEEMTGETEHRKVNEMKGIREVRKLKTLTTRTERIKWPDPQCFEN